MLALAYIAFVSLGLPDAVLGVAWPSIAQRLSVPSAALGAPLAAGACAYFVSGLFAGRMVRTLSIGGLLCASTLLALLGVLGYAYAPAFPIFLISAAVVAFGSGAIDAALNTYAARHFGAHHMTWLHAAFSCGAAASPALMTAVLARGHTYSVGYTIIAFALFAVGLAFVFTLRAWGSKTTESGATATAVGEHKPRSQTLIAVKNRAVQLHILAFFIYGGLEIAAGQWTYTVLTEARGLSALSAGHWVTAYWVSLFAGRILLGFVVQRVGTVRLSRIATFLALTGAVLFSQPTITALSAFGLSLLGFSLAPIFPGLMSETPRRVGHELAAHAVGFQVSAATLGVAVIPNIAGAIGERFGLSMLPLCFVGCAALLAFVYQLLLNHDSK
jgi:fucose permease